MTKITLNKLDVARAAAKAYREKRLSAQGTAPLCAYRDYNGCPCVIGAAIDDDTAEAWDACRELSGGSAIRALSRRGLIDSDDMDALEDLQSTHDDWARGDDTAEAVLVCALNDILPPEERIV
jgi:hypothetical protein